MQNIKELRENLLENYHALKNKSMKVKTAKELANQAQKVMYSLKLEMQYNKEYKTDAIIPFMQYAETTSLKGFGIKKQVLNSLIDAGIKTKEDLINAYDTNFDFLKLYGVGEKNVKELEDLVIKWKHQKPIKEDINLNV